MVHGVLPKSSGDPSFEASPIKSGCLIVMLFLPQMSSPAALLSHLPRMMTISATTLTLIDRLTRFLSIHCLLLCQRSPTPLRPLPVIPKCIPVFPLRAPLAFLRTSLIVPAHPRMIDILYFPHRLPLRVVRRGIANLHSTYMIMFIVS